MTRKSQAAQNLQSDESFIKFNRPGLLGSELAHIKDCILQGETSGDGPYSKRVSELLERELNAKKVFLTPSGTAALELASLALDIQPGDEIIMPSFTFVSTANAVVLRGAKPVFCDIRKDTLNLDERLIEELITPKTKAILPVHYAGVSCQMDVIQDIARSHNLRIIEDAAHALFSTFQGQALGTIGDVGAFSFHATKNYICGEGGALIISDESIIDRATVIREKGTNRTAFFRGLVDKYTWVDVGSSYLLSDILAAYLYAQLEQWQHIRESREKIHTFYCENLKSLEDRGLMQLPVLPEGCVTNYHLFHILLPTLDDREALRNFLLQKNIGSVFHYIPLHSSPEGSRLHDGRPLPVTDSASDCILRLPVFYGLTEQEQHRIVTAVNEFYS